MSNVVKLFNAPAQRTDAALQRLAAIRDILSVLDVPNIKSRTDMLRALWMLDIANTNIQLVLTDLCAVPDQRQLVRESKQLASQIELARDGVAALGGGLAVDAGPGKGSSERRFADG
jgi:hypothetical protein